MQNNLAQASVESYNNYYPFGMLMPGRTGQSANYRYGFNGKEMDNDMSGGTTGATYDYGFRIYDSRIAKFLSVDPLTKDYPWYTPYQFAGNKPIWTIDLDGLEEWLTNTGKGNVLIVPGGEKTWNYKMINELNKEDYDILKCESLEQANQALDLYNKGSYKNVVLAQHGFTNSVRLSNVKEAVITAPALEMLDGGYDLGKERSAEFSALLKITSKIESGGTFTFRHCLIAEPTEDGKENPINPIWGLSKYMLNTNKKITIFANGDFTYLSSDATDEKTYNYFDLNSKQTRCIEFIWGWARFTLDKEGKVKGEYSRSNLIFQDGKPKFSYYWIDYLLGGTTDSEKTTNKQELIQKKQ